MNPEATDRIGKKLMSYSIEDLLSMAQAPKMPSRQMGNSFRRWLRTQGYEFIEVGEFQSTNETTLLFLDGNDTSLKQYVNENLGLTLGDTRKGIDFVFRKGNRFCIGEAKFITTPGGTQTNQLDVALEVAEINEKARNVYSAAILDGVVWFYGPYLSKIKSRSNLNVMTSLLFQEFVASF